MAGSRLELIDPPAGTVLLIGAEPGDLGPFDPARTLVVQGFRPLHDAVAAQGFSALRYFSLWRTNRMPVL